MTPTDPTLMKQLGEAHLAELRAQAERRRVLVLTPRLPAWRRATGRLMLGAGLRLLGPPAAAQILAARPARTADDGGC